mmetsp:Transcript_8681/g.27577  ORF Transcript_8681/g.27577 Transcript_8681/m.27577 type:complete len:302 (-) Transcript_8681:32-937(-)
MAAIPVADQERPHLRPGGGLRLRRRAAAVEGHDAPLLRHGLHRGLQRLHVVADDGAALGVPARRGRALRGADPGPQGVDRRARQDPAVRPLLEPGAEPVFPLRPRRLRAGAPQRAPGQRLLLHDVRARALVRRRLPRHVRGALHLFQVRRARGHGDHPVGEAAGHPPALVAPRHGAALLLALVRDANRHGPLVRDDELLRAQHHVRLLRVHGRAEPAAEGEEVRDLHHALAARADGRRHLRHGPRGALPGRRPRLPREQDQLRPRPRHVLVLLPPLRQALLRELRPHEIKGQGGLGLRGFV